MTLSFCRPNAARKFKVSLALGVLCLGSCNRPRESQRTPHTGKVEEYATIEAITNGVPVWSFSNLTYIYGVSPDFMPGVVMQKGNRRPLKKIQPKRSWEIKSNFAGTESSETRRSAYNDSNPMLPIHLIDGDPSTAWAAFEMTAAKARPEWIRIDLPVEAEVASVALITTDFHNPFYGNYGRALPKELEVKTSRDALHWETVYSSKQVAQDQRVVEIKFKRRPVKQVWIIGNDFPLLTAGGGFGFRFVFSIGEVEVRDPAGSNLALVSRGSNVTVSSTSYVQIENRFTQDALWNSLNYDLGNKWVRVGVDRGSFMWHFVEHEKGKLEIDPVSDQSITELTQHGINVILCLDWKGNYIYEKPPRKTNWLEARFRTINDMYSDPLTPADDNPEMYQGYLRYVEYMVRHFKNRVSYIELGNEWNGHFGAERFVPAFFEPAYKIVRRVWPDAKVMLGNVGDFDRNAILDCLGRERQYGLRSGKLLLDAGGAWRFSAGAVAVRDGITVKDTTVSVETENKGQAGILLRYKDPNSYLVGMYAAPDHTIMFYEAGDATWGPHWGKPLAVKKVPNLGANVKLEARVQGSSATLMISDGKQNTSTTCTLQRVNEAGSVGLIHHAGDVPQLFGNFVVLDAQGKTLVKDDFAGADGTVPAGWKYISGGPNPIKPGIAAGIDALGWHPGNEPDAKYFGAVRYFQKQCRSLGFKGRFFATETYAASFYPPPLPYGPMIGSETQMAKYMIKSLVGHSGLDMESGPCHPHFTAYANPQTLCQTSWGMQTLNPCRPTMSYYMWRTVATVTDDFQPADFPVRFSDEKGLLYFTFQRGDNERMVAVWVDGPEKDGILESERDLTFAGVKARQATVVDLMNGTEQELDFAVNDSDTVLKGMLIKDYPVFIRIVQ